MKAMKIHLKVKRLSRPGKTIADLDYEIDFSEGTAADLISALVETEVERYNAHSDSDFAFLYENEEAVDRQASTGKVSFDEHISSRRAVPRKAVSTAFDAFRDGLFRLFINENELSDLDERIVLHSDDQLILFRMSFISGRCF